MVRPLKVHYRDRLKLVDRLENEDADAKRASAIECEIEFLLLARERDKINDLYRGGQLKDDPRRRIERELDLRDAQLTNLRADE
jgi:CPA1 family monovalent cation:H+ antiporter